MDLVPSPAPSGESWTVDCPCGVDFDDGEEMVDCDECGVWVHTSCCQFVPGRTSSYVCEKCKRRKERRELEEMEVALLLAKLPNRRASPVLVQGRTMALSKAESGPLQDDFFGDHRTHIHGIPGGDPSFYVGVSPVFSSQLWKLTGYVPKVFKFIYRDVPQYREADTSGSCLFGNDTDRTRDHSALENSIVEDDATVKVERSCDDRKESKQRNSMQEDKGHQSVNNRRRGDGRKRDVAGAKHARMSE